MSTVTHDTPSTAAASGAAVAERSQVSSGLLFAVVSAVSFGLAGALGRGLLDNGWSAGAITLCRVGLAAAALTPFGLIALRGRWSLLVRNWRLLLAYGVIAVAGAQFCYFSAVQHMQVGPAILIEFTSPAVIVAYLWIRYAERPGRMTVLGAALAALGLVLVLDLVSGADLSVVGVTWALAAMLGNATYFIINSHDDTGLPGIVLAWVGLLVGALALALLGLVGLLPMRGSTDPTTYAGTDVPWWLPLVTLGLVSAALSYVAGIAAGRRLGSRLASFVALMEVVASVGWAWLLLHELPGPVQLVGGVLILGGVVAVKLGERSVLVREPLPV